MRTQHTNGREPAAGIDDEELRPWVEDCLGERADGFERHALPESSSFACERLVVRRDGRTQELFFKDFGCRRLPREDQAGARREIEVYRNVLDSTLLGTPRHVGSLREPEAGRSWLLLEYVRGSRLAEQSFDHWLAAAAWLGRLQGLAAARAVAENPPAHLVVHEREELFATAEAAVQAVASVEPSFEGGLREILRSYDAIVEELCEEPRTLVHGAFRPENILVDPSVTPGRIAPLEWKHAALGCGLYDLASLSVGLGREHFARLFAAQRQSALEYGVRLPKPRQAWELVMMLRLHEVLRALGDVQRSAHARETVTHLIERAGRLEQDILATCQERALARVTLGAGPGPDPALRPGPHPAIRAWRSLGRSGTVARVERIRGPSKGRVVYRLWMDGAERTTVVAKRSRAVTLDLERHVYANVLPGLALATPQYFGWFGDGQTNWLFLEDLGGARLDPDDTAQRARGILWLAALHGESARLAPDARLPEMGPRHFLALLRSAHGSIVGALANPALRPGDEQSLRDVIAECERAQANWERIEARCSAIPWTLAHGDFRPKNLLVRQDSTLVPIDWEYSGWGVSALDLGSLLRGPIQRSDLALYRDALPADNPARHTSLETLASWVITGRILRAITSIHWSSIGLPEFTYLESPVHDLGSFKRALRCALDELAEPKIA